MEVSRIARLIGEPARATMLDALLSGEALAAGELARAARISPATASGHLARLQAGGLLDVVRAGRHRYYRLAAPEVAEALEALSLLGTAPPVRSLRASRAAVAMAEARTCYDHLAGRVGVALCDALVAREAVVAGGDGYVITPAGEKLLGELDVVVEPTRRRFARPCIDFTERRPHLAGALGAAVCGRLMELRWLVRRAPGERALRVTEAGRTGLAETFGI